MSIAHLLAQADLTKLLVVLVYLLAVAYLAYRGWRKTKTTSDYLLAGRQMHPYVMAMSYGATFISTSAIVGFGGFASVFGLSLLWLVLLNILVGIFVAFVVLGGPTRRMGHRLDAHTFPELLGRRFESKFIQFFAGAVIFLLMPLYTAAVIMGAGALLKVQFGWPYEASLFGFSAVVGVYVISGGLRGVMYTDALQGTIMFVGMLLILVLTYASFGGPQQAHEDLAGLPRVILQEAADSQPKVAPVIEAVRGQYGAQDFARLKAAMEAKKGPQPDLVVAWEAARRLRQGAAERQAPLPQLAGMPFDEAARVLHVQVSKGFLLSPPRGLLARGSTGWTTMPVLDPNAEPQPFGVANLATVGKPERMEFWLVVVTSITLGVGIGVLAQPQLAVRFMTVRSKRELNRAVLVGGLFILVLPGTAYVAGSLTNLWFYRAQETGGLTALLAAGSDVNEVMPLFVERAMPSAISAVWLVTLLAAAMSTVSSQFHAMGTSVGRDMAAPFSRTGGSAGLTRLGILVTFVLSVCLAYFLPLHWDKAEGIIARSTAIFFGICAATFLPAFVGGLFSRRLGRAAAIWGMVAGLVVMLSGFLFLHESESGPLLLCEGLFGTKCLLGAPWKWVDPLVYGLPASALTTLAVGFFTRGPSAEQVARCFGEGRGVRL